MGHIQINKVFEKHIPALCLARSQGYMFWEQHWDKWDSPHFIYLEYCAKIELPFPCFIAVANAAHKVKYVKLHCCTNVLLYRISFCLPLLWYGRFSEHFGFPIFWKIGKIIWLEFHLKTGLALSSRRRHLFCFQKYLLQTKYCSGLSRSFYFLVLYQLQFGNNCFKHNGNGMQVLLYKLPSKEVRSKWYVFCTF